VIIAAAGNAMIRIQAIHAATIRGAPFVVVGTAEGDDMYLKKEKG
jgi:hypothetical protein